MSEVLRPARPVAPGRILKQELEALGWSQKDLAAILGRPEQMVSEIANGTKQITPETALELAQALDTSPELWMNLEANYRLQMAQRQSRDDAIARRSLLYAALPLRAMARRGWLTLRESPQELEQEVTDLLGVPVGSELALPARLRSSSAREPLTYAQLAWLRRAERLAAEQTVGAWSQEHPEPLVAELLTLTRAAEDVAQAPAALARWGVRCVLLRPLERTFLDGAAFWLDQGPVVALTLRYDRIDSFWFTLLHEIAHLSEGETVTYVDRLQNGDNGAGSNELDGCEAAANRSAADWLVPPAAFRQFVAKTTPHFSRASIQAFAAQQRRHPGIVLGRLQRENLAPWKNLRSWLVKVSPYLKDAIRD
jgi:HTH-type transcriptional regulator/antitoxin HigA